MSKPTWINWFEIPASNFNRAKEFYEKIFGVALQVMDFDDFKMGIFPGNGLSGAICVGEGYKPSPAGPLLYLNANPDLQKVLSSVTDAGGRILREKTIISEQWGYMALILDTEGNRLALHSNQ